MELCYILIYQIDKSGQIQNIALFRRNSTLLIQSEIINGWI